MYLFSPFVAHFPYVPLFAGFPFVCALVYLWKTGWVEEGKPFWHWLCRCGPGSAFRHGVFAGRVRQRVKQPGETLTLKGSVGHRAAELPREAGSGIQHQQGHASFYPGTDFHFNLPSCERQKGDGACF